MRYPRQWKNLVCTVAVFAGVPGCQSFYPYRPVPVLARDAETKQPIAGANIWLSYPMTPSASAPYDSSGKAGTDGIARLRAAPYGDGASVEVTAAGYMMEHKDLSVDAVQSIEPAHFLESVDHRPPGVVVELYAEPRPTIELVVPAGFRGVIKADVRIHDDAVNPPGQRLFSFAVPPSGEVTVIGSPLLRRVFSPDFSVRFADGAPISRNAQESDIGFWWMKRDGNAQIFLVGTQSEYDTLRRAYDKAGPGLDMVTPGEKGGSGGRKGGGRHGGGGGGGMSSP